MPFITKANSKRILRKIDLKSVGDIDDTLYKKPIYFLNRWETKYLLLMKSLLKDPENFAIEIYQPIVNVDTFNYVFESEQPPSYHSSKNCERLTANFKNFEVPHEIRERVRRKAEKAGKSKLEILELEKRQVDIFRAWFKENLEIFKDNPETFLKKLEIRWNIQRRISEVERDNSGFEEMENLNLHELEKEIDRLISEAGRYFVNNKDKQQIIRRFQKLTFLAYRKEEIENNDTQLSDEELKNFLKAYDKKFKKPIKELLIQYYRIKYNPDLSFEGELLESLNFRPCSTCEGTLKIGRLIDDFLPDEDKNNENL